MTRTREGTQGVVYWALAGCLFYVVGGMLMLFGSLWIAEAILGSLGIDTGAGTLGHSFRNAAHPIGWGVFVASVSIPIGSHFVPGVRFGPASWLILTAGLGLATITTFLDIEFVRASYGVYDFEYGGASGLAGPALVAVALAGWAALSVPGGSRILAALTVAAAVGLAAVLLPSAGGAADGIAAENVPIAMTFLLDGAYALVAAVLVVIGPRSAYAR